MAKAMKGVSKVKTSRSSTFFNMSKQLDIALLGYGHNEQENEPSRDTKNNDGI
jgi:hypothetical protein